MTAPEKETKVELRPAACGEFPALLELLLQAKAYMLKTGNPQWRPGYPSLETLKDDLQAGAAYAIEIEGHLAGYLALYSRDEAFEACPLCDTSRPYVVVHRLALGDEYRGRHLSQPVMKAAAERARALGAEQLLVDTGLRNIPTQTLLVRAGFAPLGPHVFPWGERVVYRLPLT